MQILLSLVMSSIKKVADLRVYKLSLELLDPLYNIAYTIPHLKLRTQIIKSGEAIAPLIGEGFARQRNPNDAARFYEMAMIESDEVVVHLEKAIILSRRFLKISKEGCGELIKEYTELSKQLNNLRQTWRRFAEPVNPHLRRKKSDI